jgi:hypothetical protein
MITVLSDDATREVEARPDDEALWVGPAQLTSLTGYELNPEGACREDVCVPLPADLIRNGQVDVAAFWRLIGHPVLHDSSGTVWLLAEAAVARRQALESGRAPDFTLPDLEGTQYSLSEFRGKKVFLATWASW